MALYTHEDLPNETVRTSAKEIENKCTTKVVVLNDVIHNHEFSQILHQDREAHESIIATETTFEIPLHDSTMESDIDNTAELLPSGRIQSHRSGIKTAVSETSPLQLTSTVFNPKASDDLSENQPSSLPLAYSQEKHFNQLCRTESTKKLAQPSLEQPASVLDTGKREPQDTADLYSEGAHGDFFENICIRKSDDNDDEDLYTDPDLYERKHFSFASILTQRNELSREIKYKVWNIPKPADKHRKVVGMKVECGNDCQIGYTEKDDNIEIGHGETDEETLMLKSTEHGSQTNGPLGQHATSAQKFLYVSTLHESNVTNDIGLKSSVKILQDNVAEEDNQTQKMANHVCEEVNQCEGEIANDKRQKDEVDLKTVNCKNHQKLKIESNTIELLDENATLKETYDNISGISSIYPLNISKVVSSQDTFSSVEGTSNENTDSLPLSSSKTVCYDGESQPSTQLNIPTCASQEDKPLPSKDTEIQPQICSNNIVIDNIENHSDNKSAIKMNDRKARNNVTDQLGFQRNRDLSTICPETIDTRQSTPILKELISGQAHEINGISPGYHLISTSSGTVNGITMESPSSSLKNDCPGARIKTLGDEFHEKPEPSEEHQLPYFEVIDEQDKHYSRNDNNIKEVTKKHCHSHGKNSETDSQKESPEKENTFGGILQTKSHRDDKDTVPSSKIISNESLNINNVHTSSNSSDPAITSSQVTIKPTCTLTNATTVLTTCFSDASYPIKTVSPGQSYQYISPFSDPSHQSPETFPDVSNQRTAISLDSLCKYKTMSLDPHDQGQTTYPDSLYQSKSNSSNFPYEPTITSDDSTNHSTATASPNHCTISPLDPSHQCGTTVPKLCFQSRISCLDPPDQCIPISHSSTYQGKNNSSNFSALCTKTSSDPSDQCKTTKPDSFYHDKINSLDTSDQRSTMIPDPARQCSVTFLNPSDQSKTSCPDLTKQCKSNSSDLSYQFTNNSSDVFNNCNTSAPGLSNHCEPSTLDSAYQCKNNPSDQSYHYEITPFNPSHQCRTTVQKSSEQTCLVPSDQFTTISHNSTYQGTNISSDHCRATTSNSSDQGKINSLDTSDQCTTMFSASALQCNAASLNPSDQCKTHSPDSPNWCKNNSPNLPHQFTITSSDLSNQCPDIAPDSSYECRLIPGDPFTGYITTAPDLPSCDLSNQCAINYSVLSKDTTVPDSSDQYGITPSDPLGQCTIITPNPNNSQDSSYQCTIISLDRSDQCNTISLASSNHMFSISDSHCRRTSSQTPSHLVIINSSDSSDLHTSDTSDPAYQTALPDLSNQCVANAQNLPLLLKIRSDQSLNVSTSTSDLPDSCTTVSSDPVYECKTTTSNPSSHENMATSHEFSYQCTADFSNGSYQFTNPSPNQHDHPMDNCFDPCNQCTTCATKSNHQCRSTSLNASCHCTTYPSYHTVSNYDTHNQWTITSSNSPQQSSSSSPDLCISTTSADLPDKSNDIFGDPDLPCTNISLTPSYQYATTSAESSDQCTNISVDFQQSLLCENNIDCGPLRVPTQEEYGCILKQHECSFLGEVRRIYLDDQHAGFSLLDSGIILTKRKFHLKNIVVMMLRDGKKLMFRSSKFFLYYQLEKHFYVTQQLNEDWYHTQDRKTKVTMLMKKVPLTSNWLKTLHNFLCLPNDCRLLIPYAVITDRNGSVLFLMEDRDVQGVGIPPLGYMLNTVENLSKVLRFMRFCRIHRVLPRKIRTSILFTPQGICFDPSGLCNNDDLCEFSKCLKEYLLVFLFNGRQEFNRNEWELLLERAQLLLEEDWSPQICLARLLFTTTQGALPFNLPSSLNENEA